MKSNLKLIPSSLIYRFTSTKKKAYQMLLDIAKVQVAEIFLSNGIDRIDGNNIVHLTYQMPLQNQR